MSSRLLSLVEQVGDDFVPTFSVAEPRSLPRMVASIAALHRWRTPPRGVSESPMLGSGAKPASSSWLVG